MGKKLIAGIVILIILHSVIALFFITNYFNLDNALNIDRSDRAVTEKSYYFQYPFSGIPYISVGENGTTGLPTFSVEIETQYTGILTEGAPLFLAAQGYLYPDGQKTIDGIQVGYKEASWYSFIANYPPYFDVNPKKTDVYSMIIPAGTTKGIEIKWETQGDYYPFIILNVSNGSAPITIPLDALKVHVYGAEAILQQLNSRRSLGIETSLFLFAILEISATIIGYFSKAKGTNKVDSKSNQPNNKGQTYREIQKRKKRTKK